MPRDRGESKDRDADGSVTLGSLAAAAAFHALLLSLAIPHLGPRPAPRVEVRPGTSLRPTALRVPPPKTPPPPLERLEARTPKALIPTPEHDDIPLSVAGPPSELTEPSSLFDEPGEYLDVPAEPPPNGATILRPGDPDIVLPTLILASRVEPVYPPMARLVRAQGRVILQAVIRKDGTVDDIEVLEAPEERFGFADAAVQAVTRWRYIPAMQHGRPVDLWFTIVVEFELR